MPHKAIFVDASNHLDVRTITETYQPGPNHSLVEVRYSGINPADMKHVQLMSFNNTVPGYDYSGIVLAAGAGSPFAAGDAIAGFNRPKLGRRISSGAHQDLLVANDAMAFRVPPHLPLPHAAALTTVVRTAGDILRNQFGLPPPTHPAPAAPAGPALLVWGGASAVGLAVIQVARAQGVHPIVATASPARHALLQRLGATAVFDYAAPDVPALVHAYMAAAHPGVPLAKVLDCVSIPGDEAAGRPHTTDLTAACATVAPELADVCTVFPWRAYKLAIATTEKPFEWVSLDGERHVLPARVDDARRSREVLDWCVAHYGVAFEMPKVDVVPGNRALECVLDAGRGAVGGFGKVVIEHPIS